MAISFLATEIKVVGLMAPAMARLGHYFTPFQAHVIEQAEHDVSRFAMDQGLLILEREAKLPGRRAPRPPACSSTSSRPSPGTAWATARGSTPSPTTRPTDEDWRDYIIQLRARLGDVDFADLIYIRSSYHVTERRRTHPDYIPKFPTLFGEKEGKIARANRGRDPLYLFSALQRQLGYPEVPRPRTPR